MANSSTVLVLVSDIQIGNCGLFDDLSERHLTFAHELASHIRNRYDSLPGGEPKYSLFIPGDLASCAKRTEYQCVEEFILVLAGVLGVRRKDIYMCPGNHDYDLTKCTKSQHKERFDTYAVFHDDFYKAKLDESWGEWIRAKKTLESRLTEKEMERATQALEQSLDTRTMKKKGPERMNYFERNEELGIEVLSFNSASRCSKGNTTRYGWFPRSEIADIVPANGLTNQYVRICMGHHNFDSMNETDLSPIRNPWEQREFLRRHSFRFAFHGHQHREAIQRWSDINGETVLVGCGSVAADVKELVPGIPHNVTCVILDSTFATIESFPYNHHDKGWRDMPSSVDRVGLEGGQVTIFRTREAVSKANRDLILAARSSVEQTFIKSNAPKEDALRLLLDKTKNINVHRIISARSWSPINSRSRLEFARSCVELSDNPDLHVRVDHFEPGHEAEYPYVNLLLVDGTDVIINFSRAETGQTDALHIRDPKMVTLLHPFFKAHGKNLLTKEVLLDLESHDRELGPWGAPRSFIEELKEITGDLFDRIDIVGSSTHEGLAYPARVYDVDVLLTAEEVNEQRITILSQTASSLARKHSSPSLTLLVEDRFGPFRPRLPGRSGPVTVQMHLNLMRPQEFATLPLPFRLAFSSVLAQDYLTETSLIPLEMATFALEDAQPWSLASLESYCADDWFPFSSWGYLDSEFGRIRSRYILRENWERLELYGFVARLTLSFLLLAHKTFTEPNKVFGKSDEGLISTVNTVYGTNNPSRSVLPLLKARRLDRHYGFHELPEDQLDAYQSNIVDFVRWTHKKVSSLLNNINTNGGTG